MRFEIGPMRGTVQTSTRSPTGTPAARGFAFSCSQQFSRALLVQGIEGVDQQAAILLYLAENGPLPRTANDPTVHGAGVVNVVSRDRARREK